MPGFWSAAAPHTADRRSYRECMSTDRSSARAEHRGGVDLTNLDQPLGPTAGATKRDLVDYLDAVAERMLPGLAGRPLSVLRVHRGQEPFMQKNVPKYTPEWVQTVSMWAEASKREVHYALCDDRRTLLWFANQRAIEYHPTLGLAPNIYRTHPPRARPRPARRRRLRRGGRRRAPRAAGARRLPGWRVRSRPAARKVCTCSCRSTMRSGRGRRRLPPAAIAARAEALDPDLATTAFIVRGPWRQGIRRLDPSRRRDRRRRVQPAVCGREHRSPSRWTGPTSTGSRLATSLCTPRSTHLPAPTRGLNRCLLLSGCRTI